MPIYYPIYTDTAEVKHKGKESQSVFMLKACYTGSPQSCQGAKVCQGVSKYVPALPRACHTLGPQSYQDAAGVTTAGRISSAPWESHVSCVTLRQRF